MRQVDRAEFFTNLNWFESRRDYRVVGWRHFVWEWFNDEGQVAGRVVQEPIGKHLFSTTYFLVQSRS